MPKKRFNSEKSAKEFALRVNGKINDLRYDPNAKSNFTVTYYKNTLKVKEGQNFNFKWAKEDNMRFGNQSEYFE